MDFRAACIDLLKRENTLLNLYRQQPRKLPDLKKRVLGIVKLLVILVVVFLGRKWLMGIQENLFAEHKFSTAGIFLRVPVGACLLAMIALVILLICKVIALFTAWGDYRNARRSNTELERRKASALKHYNELRGQVMEAKKKEPALAGRHLFFDDPHPLETTQAPERGKQCGANDVIYRIGELALRVLGENYLRMDGYYAPKHAKVGELASLLKDPQYPYACPIWDKSAMEADPLAECRIYTLTRLSIKAVPRDNRDHESPITPETAFGLYYSAEMGPVAEFVRSGLNGMPNRSAAEDERPENMRRFISKYMEEIRNDERIKSSEYCRYGCARAYLQQMGYVVTTDEQEFRVLAVIIPRFYMPIFDLFYSLDLFYDEQTAKQQLAGQVMSLVRDFRGAAPDFLDTVRVALEVQGLPAFDPLQDPPENLDRAAWHELLRMRAAKEE